MLPAAYIEGLIHNNTLRSVSAVGIFVFITLPVMLLEVLLYQLSVAKVYTQGSENCCCQLCTWLLACFKGTCFCLSIVLALVVGGTYLGLLAINHGEAEIWKALRPFWVSRVQSWIAWFPIWFFMPYLGFLHYWRIERRKQRQPNQAPRQASSAETRGAAAEV